MALKADWVNADPAASAHPGAHNDLAEVANAIAGGTDGQTLAKASDDDHDFTWLTPAPLASPALTGVPTVPTAAPGTSTTQIASTEFATTADNLRVLKAGDTVTGALEVNGALTKGGSAVVVTTDSRLSDTRTPSNDSSLVHKAGTESITGDKTFSGAVALPSGTTGLTKTTVGLSNVDNTTDVGKPVSTAQQTALNLKADLASPALTGTPTAPVLGVAGTAMNKIFSPSAGSQYFAGAQTGAIKITLPQSWTSTVVRMRVKVYNYATPSAFEVVCAGYTPSAGGGDWLATTAQITSGTASATPNYTVRFGHDGTKCCVYIGELATTWSALLVSVESVEVAATNYTIASWATGWTVSLEASAFGTIKSTITNTLVGRYLDGNTIATLASPALTGTPTAPTAAANTNTTQLATTAFVTTADNLKAPLASPTFTGTVIVDAIKVGAYTAERSFVLAFADGVANQKADLCIGATTFEGIIEVTLSGSYANAIAEGVVRAVFVLGGSSSGTRWDNAEWHYTDIAGQMPTHFGFLGLSWDSTNTRWRIPIGHRTSTGNTIAVSVRLMANSAAQVDNANAALAISAVYTTDATAVGAPVAGFSAGGITIGDTNLYRSAADTLKTDDALEVVGALTKGGVAVTLTNDARLRGPLHAVRASTYVFTIGAGSAGNSTTVSADAVCVSPIIIAKDTTIDRITLYINNGVATAVWRLGVYADNGTYPGAKLLDAGTVDASTSGAKEITLGSALTVTAGLYWVAAKCETAFAAARGTSGPVFGVLTNSNGNTSDVAGGYLTSYSSAGLPDPFTAYGGSGWGMCVTPPRVGVRVTG